ncbi:MAG: 50S ribosomal protein L18 [Actinomycetota bacterium]
MSPTRQQSNRKEARRHRQIRIRKGISGTAQRPRLSVFRSNRYIYAQVIDDVSGRTLAAASSQESGLRDRRLNEETAAEVGKLIGGRARQAGVGSVVFDRGGFAYHGRVKSLADGARAAGLEF